MIIRLPGQSVFSEGVILAAVCGNFCRFLLVLSISMRIVPGFYLNASGGEMVLSFHPCN
jgi:hypothetical protein